MHVVLIHGAWHGGWCWDEVRGCLASDSLTVHAPDLPFTGHADDVAYVRAFLDDLGGPCVVVGHSYGGLVISGAAAGRTDVTHLVYVCAFMVPEGGTVFDEMSPDDDLPELLNWIRADQSQSWIDPEGAVASFYAHTPPELARPAVARLRPMEASSTRAASLGSPWTTAPSTYLVCERDEAIGPGMQRLMARRADNVITLDTDHSPFLSMPAETAQAIIDVTR